MPDLPTLVAGQDPTEEHIRVLEAWLRDHPQTPGGIIRTAHFNLAAEWWNALRPDTALTTAIRERLGQVRAQAQRAIISAGEEGNSLLGAVGANARLLADAAEVILNRHRPMTSDVSNEVLCAECTPGEDHYLGRADPCPTKIEIARAFGIEVE
jgi:hypothetical protein